MSQPYVTGPCPIYVHVGGGLSSKAPVFFGWTEDTPEIRIDHEFEPLFNALGGGKIPSDQVYQGSHAFLRGDFTRYTQSVYSALQAVPFFTGTPGFCPFGDLGTLMLTEGAFYPITVGLPYAGKAAMSGMPAGFRFLACWLEGDQFGLLSTKPRKISLTWTCQRVFNITNLSWTLYDNVTAGLPAVS